MPYFRKNDAGEYVEVPDEELEIPEAVVKAHPVYKGVLAESIERRKELKALKDAQQAQPVTEASGTQTPEPAKPDPVDVSKVIEEATSKVVERLTAQQRQEQAFEADLAAIIAAEHLPADIAPVLRAFGSVDAARQHAKTLAAAGLRFDPTPSGGNGKPTVTADRLKALDEQLGLPIK